MIDWRDCQWNEAEGLWGNAKKESLLTIGQQRLFLPRDSEKLEITFRAIPLTFRSGWVGAKATGQ